MIISQHYLNIGAGLAKGAASKRRMKKNCSIIAVNLFALGTLLAAPVNITVFDGQAGNGAVGPWAGNSGSGVGNEDNETEPWTITGDVWDVEGFVMNGTKLSLVGTYDFKNGQLYGGHVYTSGAIFVGLHGNNNWDYALTLNFNNNTFGVYKNFTVLNPSDIPASAPWNISGGDLVGTGALTYDADVTDPFGQGFKRADGGTWHNVVTVDLAGLPDGLPSDTWFHYDMSCGNDLVVGHYSVPDGGATAMLLGVGFMGIIFIRRKLRTTD